MQDCQTACASYCVRMKLLICVSVLLGSLLRLPAEEVRVWRVVGMGTFHASFVSYDEGTVRLRRHDGQILDVRVERLTPRDRSEVQRLAGEDARGSLPAGEVDRGAGRRALTWRAVVRGNPWPAGMLDREREALFQVSRSWNHADTAHVRIHYQDIGYARTVARQADFFYEFIAADLPGFRDRMPGRSSIVILANRRDWERFLAASGAAPEWAAAYVRGPVMFLQAPGTGQSQVAAHVLAHEMSHLVLNRFFPRPPPLWLNEGLAEWYGSIAWKAFQGRRALPHAELTGLRDPLPLAMVLAVEGYPADPQTIGRFYRTSHHLVGFLMLQRDQQAFVRFLERITVNGLPQMQALREVYGFESVAELEAAFHQFLREKN